MNYYERWMGDYIRDTSHLSLLEHGVYTRLMDVYYTREAPLPEDNVARLIGARSKDEKLALDVVLEEFFTLADGTWIQDRCQKEVDKYLEKARKNREVGKLGGRPPKKQTTVVPKSEPTDNHGGFILKPTDNPPQSPVPIEEEEAKASLPESAIPAKPKPSPPACPIDSLIDSFAKHLPGMPTVNRGLFKAGKGCEAMRARWRWVMTSKHERGSKKGEPLAQTAADGIDWFDRFFSYVAGSDFLTGRDGKWVACDLHWLMTASKFEAVLGGKYHTKEAVAA